MKETYDVVIIGAGPAGLSAGYELSKKNLKVLIIEKKNNVGGLAETKVFGEYRYDIGPHRFFTKNQEIEKLFLTILGDDSVEVDRFTRIFYKNKFFNYPLTIVNAIFGLGFLESIFILLSFIWAKLKNLLRMTSINNFEEWVTDKFGKKLFQNFFKVYTEKVWGINCSEIGVEWAAQRIKGLSLYTAIKTSLFPNSTKKPKSLINKFHYPRLGAGMLWEKLEKILQENGIDIIKNCNVKKIKKTPHGLSIISVRDKKNLVINSRNIFFSNPLVEFVNIFDVEKSEELLKSVRSLKYRSHISVHITIDKKLFRDNWIYIHSKNVNVARISDFTNFSNEMSPPETFSLTLEYFCYDNDKFYNEDSSKIVEFAIKELKTIFPVEFNILHSAISKNRYAYPVIKTGFENEIKIIKNWLNNHNEITPIGRTGMFKYNNQDHAMATGIYAARKYLGLGNYDPWLVNVDGEYIEEIRNK